MVHIEDFAEIIGAELHFSIYWSQNQRVSVQLKKDRMAEVIGDYVLIGRYGDSYGADIHAAIADYVKLIKGREITFDYNKTRIKVPDNLYYKPRKVPNHAS